MRGVMLRIHGGGWAAGAPEDDDTVNDAYARACNLVVRLAGVCLSRFHDPDGARCRIQSQSAQPGRTHSTRWLLSALAVSGL